jgi:hypothetical protein
MNFLEAEQTISRWLARCGMAAVNGRMLDAQGCCSIALDGCPEILLMLPANQTSAYFYGMVCELDMARDNGLLALAMILNLDPAHTRGTALGFDPERRQVLLRAVQPLENTTDEELDRVLQNFGDLTRQLNDYFERCRQEASAGVPSGPSHRGGSLSVLTLNGRFS